MNEKRRVTLHGGPKDGWVMDVPRVWGGDGYPPVIQWRPANVGESSGEVKGVYLRRSVLTGSVNDYDWRSEIIPRGPAQGGER